MAVHGLAANSRLPADVLVSAGRHRAEECETGDTPQASQHPAAGLQLLLEDEARRGLRFPLGGPHLCHKDLRKGPTRLTT